MTTSETQPAVACDVAPSTLVLLSGDLFVTPCQPGEKGTKVFSSGAVVPDTGLARMMMAAGLARLHRDNVVKLEQYTKKTLRVITTHGVSVTLTGEFPESVDRYDPRLVRWLKGSKKAASGKETVKHLIERSMPDNENPWGTVIQFGIDEAVEKGYLTRHKTGTLHRKSTVEPNTDRIQTLRPAAEAFAAEWTAFYKEDNELANAVREQVEKGLETSVKDDDDVDFD